VKLRWENESRDEFGADQTRGRALPAGNAEPCRCRREGICKALRPRNTRLRTVSIVHSNIRPDAIPTPHKIWNNQSPHCNCSTSFAAFISWFVISAIRTKLRSSTGTVQD
jgi:hypothetical protein